MEDKIEVNEYVRTKDGKIGIFDRYSLRKENSLYKSPFNCFIKIRNRKAPLQCCEDYIVKHSKQLIDLIEVGDIVKDKYNKYEVAFVKDDKIYCNDYNLDDSLITLREQDMKEILAREQFEANCYKVGGEDE